MKGSLCVRSLAVSLLCAAALAGQEPGRLQIRVLEGEGALNNIKQKVAHNPAVEVVDENGRPVAGAEVVFTLPFSGPSGTINGARTFQGKTDAEGRIAMSGMKPNDTEGRFVIKVDASKDGRQGNIVIAQVNTTAGGRVDKSSSSGGHKKLVGILAAIGGGVAIGVASMSSGDNGKTAAAPAGTSISVGGVSIGGPK